MSVSGKFWLPGPVEVDDEVMRAMLHPMIGHRGEAAHQLVARMQPGLQALFATTRPVMLATGSATAMMEAAIRSGVRDHVLCIVSGTFGERFANIAERCGRTVTRLCVHAGNVVEPDMLRTMLDGPRVDAVTMVHSETSTGVLAPVAELLLALRERDDVITIVDAVTSVGAMAIETDAWQPDFIFTGSQKAMGLPPGLAFAIASDRYLGRARQIEDRGFYLDVIDLVNAAIQGRFPQTPALPVVFALESQLQRMASEGLPNRFARHAQMRARVESWSANQDRCRIWGPVGRRSPSVTGLLLDDDLSAIALAEALNRRGFQVAAGLEQFTDRVIRIGHMGEVTANQLDDLLEALGAELKIRS